MRAGTSRNAIGGGDLFEQAEFRVVESSPFLPFVDGSDGEADLFAELMDPGWSRDRVTRVCVLENGLDGAEVVLAGVLLVDRHR